MSTPPSPKAASKHVLEEDPARLEHIIDVMWAEIHKVLHLRSPRRRRRGNSDVIGQSVTDQLTRSGVSAEDVLAVACSALLLTPETDVTGSWESYAVGIARHKTKDALREAEAWLHETDSRPRLTVVSADAPGRPGPDGEPGEALLELLIDDDADLEDEFIKTEQQLELIRLARETLNERDRTIFIGMHFGTRTRVSLSHEFSITPPGVSHVYRDTARRLYEHPRFQRYTEGGAQ